MDSFELTFDVRWADIDANQHMRHSAYYDYAAHLRVKLLKDIGLDLVDLSEQGIGPVLFREEAVFMREIGPDDRIVVNARLQRSREDGSRWTFIHEFFKSADQPVATVTVDGAWINLEKRKLTGLPEDYVNRLFAAPKTEDFEMISVKGG